MPDVIAFLARLVGARSPNPPGNEAAVAEVIRRQAVALGLPEPRFHEREPARPNLILRIGDGPPNLALAAHMDTMPAGDRRAWQSHPFRLTPIHDRLAGLGSVDMKAAIAAMLFAAARIHRQPESDGSLTLIFSADEEGGSTRGMQWLAEQGLLTAGAAVVVEPSSVGVESWERLFVGQRGSCVSWLVARGEPGHSSIPVPPERRASSAFARALAALIEANAFEGWLDPIEGAAPTLNIATIVEGGMVPFAHPSALRAAIDVRTLEGMTEEIVLQELRRILFEAGLADRVSIEPAEAPLNWIPAGDTVSDERLLTAAITAWREVIGKEPALGVYPAGTDSVHLSNAGIPALPAYGPGSLAVAHQPNEAIRADDVLKAVDLFEALVRHYHRARPGGERDDSRPPV